MGLNFSRFFSRVRSDLAKSVKRDFFHRFNTDRIKELMAKINTRDVKCNCKACLEADRMNEEDYIFGLPHVPCKFAPYWEKLLRMYKISFVHKPLDGAMVEMDGPDSLKGLLYLESAEALVSVSCALFYL